MDQTSTLFAKLGRIQRTAIILGAIGLLISVVGVFINREQFFQSYLVSFTFWMQLSVGSLAVLMIQHLAGGKWGVVIQRPLEAAAVITPLILLMALPLFFGLSDIYIWAQPKVVAQDALLQHKAAYLNEPFFIIRALSFIIIWSVIAYFLHRWSIKRDETRDPIFTKKLKNFSGPAMVVLGITASFASFDWMMSLEPHWFSTIYGMIFFVSAGASAFAFVILILSRIDKDKALAKVVTIFQYNDLGNFLLTMVILWAYVEFSQFLIIWLGNMNEEIPWYIARRDGGWNVLEAVVMLFHFAVPFLVLLSRSNKRNVSRLAGLAWVLLLVRYLDLYWFIKPAFSPGQFTMHWLDLTTLIGLGGVWLAVFIWQLKKHQLIPQYDPRLEEEVTHGQQAIEAV